MTLGDLHAIVTRMIQERPAAALNVVEVRVVTADGPAEFHARSLDADNRLGATFVVAHASHVVVVEAPEPPRATRAVH
jgi:hypothetical protein